MSDEMSDGTKDKETLCWMQIKKYMKTHEFIMNADVRVLRNVSAATRYINGRRDKLCLIHHC